MFSSTEIGAETIVMKTDRPAHRTAGPGTIVMKGSPTSHRTAGPGTIVMKGTSGPSSRAKDLVNA